MDTTFSQLMRHLFRHMDIEMPRHQDDEAYAVSVDGTARMKFFVAPAGYLNIVSVVAAAPQAAPALLGLLKMNSFTPVLPDFNFKVGVEQGGNVELWMREPLRGLEPDRLVELFHLFLEVAGYVRNHLERALTGVSPHHIVAGILPQEAAA